MEANRKDLELVTKELKEKHEQHPGDDLITFEYAEINFQLGNFVKAKELILPLIEKSLPQAVYLLAQIESLSGNYKEAEELFQELVNDYPMFKDKAEEGLQLVYYHTNQFSKAKNLSIATDSENVFGTMLQAFDGRVPYHVKWDESVNTIIPFLVTDPVPVIQTEIKGRLYNFLIDTGGGDTFINESLAASMSIKAIDCVAKGTFAGGKTADIRFGILDAIKLNNVEITSVPVILHSSRIMKAISSIYRKNKIKLDGVIGVGILKQFLATMDYPAGQLTLRPKETPNIAIYDSTEVPFVLAATHYIVSKCNINGMEINIFHDSGLALDKTAILFPKDTANYTNTKITKRKSTISPGGAGFTFVRMGLFNVDSFKLGELPEAKNLKGVTGIFPETLYFDKENGFFIDALVSHEFYRKYKWTIDFTTMTMSFSK